MIGAGTIGAVSTIGSEVGLPGAGDAVDAVGDLFGGGSDRPGEGKDAINWASGGQSTVTRRWQEIAEDTSKTTLERTVEAFRVLSRNVHSDEQRIQAAEWNATAAQQGFPRISNEVTIEDGVTEYEVRSAIVSGSGSLPAPSTPTTQPTDPVTTQPTGGGSTQEPTQSQRSQPPSQPGTLQQLSSSITWPVAAVAGAIIFGLFYFAS